jgi:Domain of unknown function (DUF4258)
MELDAVVEALSAGQSRFTDHAREQMARREIAESDVGQLLTSPEEIVSVREGRVVVQGMVGGYLL